MHHEGIGAKGSPLSRRHPTQTVVCDGGCTILSSASCARDHGCPVQDVNPTLSSRTPDRSGRCRHREGSGVKGEGSGHDTETHCPGDDPGDLRPRVRWCGRRNRPPPERTGGKGPPTPLRGSRGGGCLTPGRKGRPGSPGAHPERVLRPEPRREAECEGEWGSWRSGSTTEGLGSRRRPGSGHWDDLS